VRLSSLARRWASFASIFLFVALIQSLFGPEGKVLLGVGNAAVLTVPGLRLGLFGLLRLLSILQGGLVLARVRTRDMTRAFQKMGLPDELALASALGAGFVPHLREEFRDALDHLKTRGVPLDRLRPWARLRFYGRLLTPILGLTLRKARELSEILELRGFRGGEKRTSFRELRFKVVDYLLMALALAVLGLGLFLFR
jgi:energy-coupling factor transport system permease protein